MTDERITERIDAEGKITERVVERGDGPRIVERRSSGGMVIAFVLLIAAAMLGFFLFSMSNQETRQADAISNAAESVGEGARQVGDAAERAADEYTGDKRR